MLKRLINNQKGNVLIITALSMLVFIGFSALAIDVGIMYSERAKLVSAVDAAALAGVWALPNDSDAIDKASKYLDKNVDDTTKLIEKKIEILTDAGTKIVSVWAVKRVDLFFARVIGHENADVSALAKASRTPAKGVSGVIPIGITKGNWENLEKDYGKYKNADGSITLKVISSTKDEGFDPEKGNFYALHLYEGEGGGANLYRQYLENGYPNMLYTGDIRATEPGNMVGPTKRGLNNRLSGNTCTIDISTKVITHTCGGEDKDCPRLAYIPVFEVVRGNLSGETDIRIIGFLPLFITNASNDGEVNGIFLDDTITDGIPGNESTPEYGVNAPKLIE